MLCDLLLAESKGRTILEMHPESGLWDCALRVLVGQTRRGLWEARRRVRGSKGERRGQAEGPLPPLLPVSREDSTVRTSMEHGYRSEEPASALTCCHKQPE